MRSLSPPGGASCETGGHLCGHADGNTYNFADECPAKELGHPAVQGKVSVFCDYTSDPTAPVILPCFSVHLPLADTIAPLLQDIEIKLPQIASK